MTRKEALADLIAKVEAGTLAPVDLTVLEPQEHAWTWLAYEKASLEAAQALHEAVLPKHFAKIKMWPIPPMARADIGGGHAGRADNPARAWLLAILRALHAMEADT